MSQEEEVGADEYGIISAGGSGVGQFQTLSSPLVDRWWWRTAPFPSSGFSITFQSSGGIADGIDYPGYSFLTSTSVPVRQWPGSKLFSISKNGTLIGWFEADTSSPAKLMWWSNGQSLVNNLISVKAGDVLAFATITALPTYAVRPLQFSQTAL